MRHIRELTCTKQLAPLTTYWPGLDNDIDNTVSQLTQNFYIRVAKSAEVQSRGGVIQQNVLRGTITKQHTTFQTSNRAHR